MKILPTIGIAFVISSISLSIGCGAGRGDLLCSTSNGQPVPCNTTEPERSSATSTMNDGGIARDTSSTIADDAGYFADISDDISESFSDSSIDASTNRDDATPPKDTSPSSDGSVPECPLPPFGRPQSDSSTVSTGSGGPGGIWEDTLEISGTDRDFRVIVPPCHDDNRVYGLAVVLHDSDGNREYLQFKWAEPVRKKGYLAVFPKALRGASGAFDWREEQNDNVTFIRLLVEHMENSYKIDTTDTILAGLGTGATFAGIVATSMSNPSIFEHLLLVNGSFLDPTFGRLNETFVIDGLHNLTDDPRLQEWAQIPSFRYEYVEGLGAYYPGPACPFVPGDPDIAFPNTDTAIEFFWELHN